LPLRIGSQRRSCAWLCLENLIALGEHDPGPLAPGPYVPRGPQPGCIVERAAPDADNTIPRHPANPRAALRANQSDVNASAIGGALKLTWLYARQAKSLLGDNHPQGERAAGQPLAIETVAGIDCLWLLGDLVVDLPAETVTGLWKLHPGDRWLRIINSVPAIMNPLRNLHVHLKKLFQFQFFLCGC
jgi:hypothetical protein